MTATIIEPKEWESGGGTNMKVDTTFTTRARELADLYRGLIASSNARPSAIVKERAERWKAEQSKERDDAI